jgi:hypothetical protein
MNDPGYAQASWMPNFDELGVDLVRGRLESGSWASVVRDAASDWLVVKEREARDKLAARNTEVADAQIRAANAAESQAITARWALFVAIAAALMATSSLLISIIALHGQS